MSESKIAEVAKEAIETLKKFDALDVAEILGLKRHLKEGG